MQCRNRAASRGCRRNHKGHRVGCDVHRKQTQQGRKTGERDKKRTTQEARHKRKGRRQDKRALALFDVSCFFPLLVRLLSFRFARCHLPLIGGDSRFQGRVASPLPVMSCCYAPPSIHPKFCLPRSLPSPERIDGQTDQTCFLPP